MINPGHPNYQNTPASPNRARLEFTPADASARPAVTIVTPFYNANALFHETAESVFRQSLQQWEWLIVNDGSTDPEALRILEKYRRKDSRIRVVDHPQNKGLSAARNTGFREAAAPYVYQLDADDLIEPTTLEKLAWHLATRPNVAFTTGFTVGFGSKEYLWEHGFHSGRLFLRENPVTATCLVRKAIHAKVGGYDESIRGGLEDWDFWMRSASHGHWGSTIPEYFDWYRRRETNREHWDNVTQTEKFEKFRARLQQKYPRLWQNAFPEIAPPPQQLFFPPATELPFANRLGKSKPRLLFIVPHFELGGADKFNLDLIRQLQQTQGWEVTVVATRAAKHAWLHEFESLTPDVFVLQNFLAHADYAPFLRYLIASRQVDAVCLSNSQLGYQLLPWLRAHFPGLPFIDYLHMEEEAVGGGYPRCSILYQSQLARTVVSSAHLKNWMIARGAGADQIDVCPTNIDTELWSRKRFDRAALFKKWNLDPACPVILHAGRVCAQKQPQVFLRAIAELARRHSQFKVLVAGDGPDLPALKEAIDRERLSQVRLLGSVPNDAIAELLAISDIFFLPSQWEGISLAIFEAMSMEVVPVGADVGGQRELVASDCGILVRRGDNEAADYANALHKLLKSPDQRRSLAAAARKRVQEKFELADLGRRFNAILQAARAAAPNGRAELPSPALAAMHTTEVIEQVRSLEYAERLRLEQKKLVPFTRHSIEWQSALRTGQALARAKQNEAAIQALQDGIRAAAASGIPEIELAARVELAQVLGGLDRAAAENALAGALALCDQMPDPGARQTVQQGLVRLAEILKKRPVTAPAPTPTRPGVPMVSVVIPCYKQAHFLPDAVASVVCQTFKDWEIIVVNDGSPDNTSDVARSLISQYPGQRIRLVEKSNGGLSSARNAGFKAAHGKYVLPLDADDQIKPTLLEKLTAVLDSHPKVGFAYTHIQHFGDIDTEWPLPDFNPVTLISKDNIVICCSLCRKSMWEQVGGYNENMRDGYEDWDFWIGCVEKAWTGYCHHEALFMYRKHGHSMINDANAKRERIIASIILNHPKLYNEQTRQSARALLDRHAASQAATPASAPATPASVSTPLPAASAPATVPASGKRCLRITYLISSILGVTGGNQTLLRQAEEMRRRGHTVTIVTSSPKPDWFQFEVRVIQVPNGKTMAACVPPSDVVVATYFVNAPELRAVNAPVKIYYAQGDQFVFADDTMADTELNQKLRELSRASYLMPGVKFVPNSHNLAGAVEKLCGRRADATLPVCTDQTIFRPLQRSLPGSRLRLLIVGPDARGTEAEPLLFKGIQDIHDALQMLARKNPHFTAVRMSGTGPEIFARFPCEFYSAPADEMKTVLFGTSHIHIYASHYDSCPRPPQEAMAAGCAVVCTATGGALEYCRDGENALLVPIKSPEAIASAVERLMSDHALREKLAQGGLATAAQFPREREWNEWEEILLRFATEADGNSEKPAVVAATPASTPAVTKAPAKPVKITLPACALLGQLGGARELLRKKEYRSAWNEALAAIAQRPFHPEAWLLLGEIAKNAGDFNRARQCAGRAIELAPDWKPAAQLRKSLSPKPGQSIAWPSLPEAPASPRLSVCLIAKNEERFLEQCLNSVRDLAHQIVVVDTGSTDRTVEIARKFNAQVHEFAWTDDFSAARNEALKYTTGDWVLMIDPDEELMPEHRENLLKEMQSERVIAWRLPIIDKGREAEGCSYVPRLYRNAPALFYVGRVHEQVFSSLEVRREEWGLENRFAKSTLFHHGYTPELVASRDKINRNLRLLQLAINELPDEPNLLMNYGLELVRSGQSEAGLERYREAFQLMTALPPAQVVPELRESLLTQFASQLMAAKRPAEIVQALVSPLARAGGLTASQHFMLGLAHLELKEPAQSAEQMRLCLKTRKRPAYSPVNPEIFKAAPNHCLALSLLTLKQDAAAEEAFQAALVDEPKSRLARFDYACFLAQRDRSLDALKVLHTMIGDGSADAQVWRLGGQIALSKPDFVEFAGDWTREAIKHLPEDPTILLQRAESLLLAQDLKGALPLWARAASDRSARHLAALVLCEFGTGNCQRQFEAGEEPLISREFLKWYQTLLACHAHDTVRRINARVEQLETVLPTFARMLQAATKAAAENAAQPAVA